MVAPGPKQKSQIQSPLLLAIVAALDDVQRKAIGLQAYSLGQIQMRSMRSPSAARFL
jgi:hypothetical protein